LKLHVFHGSPISGITSLREGQGVQYQRVAGIYFSKSREEAEKYTKINGIKHPENVIEAYVSLKNPANRKTLDQVGYKLDGLQVREKLKELGHDGVIDDLMAEVIVFDPSQITIIKNEKTATQWIKEHCRFADL